MLLHIKGKIGGMEGNDIQITISQACDVNIKFYITIKIKKTDKICKLYK